MADLFFSHDAEEADAALGTFLRRQPVDNNVPLMLLARQTARPEPGARFWWSGDGGRVNGVCFQAGAERGVHLQLFDNMVPDVDLAARFAVEIAAAAPGVPAVDGPVRGATSFAAAWATALHVPVRPGMLQQYYVLDQLTMPPGDTDRVRLGTADDIDTVMPWAIGFQRDTHGATRAESDHASTVDFAGLAELLQWKLDNSEIWILDDDGPRCMAGATLPVDGVSRINLVYTPPEHRGHGLAASCTAGAVAGALERGASHCVLFTDLANPTSNAIYQRLGFEPAGEHIHIDFG